MRRVIRVVQEQRDARYGLLRGYFHGADDNNPDDAEQARLTTVSLPVAGKVAGKPLGDLALHAMGVQVISLRRANGKPAPLDDSLPLQGGDTLVLSGTPTALAVAEGALLAG